MTLRILIDTNIAIDLILDRAPFVDRAIEIFQSVDRGEFEGFVSATTITDIFYIVCKARDRDTALSAIIRLLDLVQLCTVDRKTLETAIARD
ncbi:MAG: type II toxin-antitoxin system VapC family toxin [Cyanophyceae cyanobacterium]